MIFYTIMLPIIIGLLFFTFFIVKQQSAAIVERFGKYNREASPGLNIVIPGIEKLIIVDMREAVIDVPPQEVITKDNVTITVDAVIYYEPTDPKSLVYNVEDFITAATKLAQTNLRNVNGLMTTLCKPRHMVWLTMKYSKQKLTERQFLCAVENASFNCSKSAQKNLKCGLKSGHGESKSFITCHKYCIRSRKWQKQTKNTQRPDTKTKKCDRSNQQVPTCGKFFCKGRNLIRRQSFYPMTEGFDMNHRVKR